MIPGWVRSIPHPTYGYYGGKSKKWCAYEEPKPHPIDAMDRAFLFHDIELYVSNFFKHDKAIYKLLREKGDRNLGRRLRLNLKPFYHKFWGPTYNRLARLIFHP